MTVWAFRLKDSTLFESKEQTDEINVDRLVDKRVGGSVCEVCKAGEDETHEIEEDDEDDDDDDDDEDNEAEREDRVDRCRLSAVDGTLMERPVPMTLPAKNPYNCC